VLAGFAAQLLGEGYRGGLEGLHLQELGKGEISDLSAKFQYVVCALRALVEEANHCRDRTCIRQPTWQVLEQWGWMISPSPNCTPILSPEGKSIARRYEEFAASAGEGTSIPPPPPKRPPAPGNVT
jgi:hypothetical protein